MMLPTTSQPLDLVGIDQNLQAIRTLEGAWSLPGLPEEVTFDLASSPIMGTSALSSFLLGIDEDIAEAQKQQPYAVPNPGIWTPGNDQYTPPQQLGRLVYGITGDGSPRQFDVDAVVNWKRRATADGYLDLTQAQINDQRWLPEYGAVASAMAVDQMRADFQGDKPGSVPISAVMNFVEDWISPRGLYKAAVALDVMWDPADIYSEAQEWGDKWRHVLENPTSPRSWLDALTGPIDDVVFPILNVALLFTGIGEVYWMGKAAYTGIRVGTNVAKGYQTARAASGLYRGMDGIVWAANNARLPSFLQRSGSTATRGFPRVGEAIQGAFLSGDSLADLERFRKVSLTSQIMTPRAVGRPVTAAGRGLEAFRGARGTKAVAGKMEQWRSLNSTVMIKKMNQQAFRLGITSNLESLVDDKRGHSLATATSIDDWLETTFENPLVDWGVDLLFFPPNIFELGTIGRTIGAGAEIGKKVMRWSDVSGKQELLMAYNAPMRRIIEESGRDPKQFDRVVKRIGLQQALANELTGGNKEVLGQAMAFTTIMGVLNVNARTAGEFGEISVKLMGEADRAAYHVLLNKAKAQIRLLDPNDIDDVINLAARYGTGDIEQISSIVDEASAIFKRTSKIQHRASTLREPMLESLDDVAARAGGTQDNHVRLYGHRTGDDMDTIVWSATREGVQGNNPYTIDVSLDELAARQGINVDEARKLMDAAPDGVGKYFQKRFSIMGTDATTHQARLSDMAGHRQFRQDKMQGLQELARGHNAKRKAFLTTIMNTTDPRMLEQYIYETMDTFGNWTKFTEAMSEVDDAFRLGQLANARYSRALSPSGQGVSLFPYTPDGKWTEQVDNIFMALPDDIKLVRDLNKSVFSPLASTVDAGLGRFTVAHIDTVTKQEALGFGAAVRRVLKNAQTVKAYKEQKILGTIMDEADEMLTGTQAGLAGMTGAPSKDARLSAIATEIAAKYNFGEKKRRAFRQLLIAADQYGVTMKELERNLDEAVVTVMNDVKWSSRFNVPTTTGRTSMTASTPIEVVQKQLVELQKQSHWMASAVEDIPTQLVDDLARRDYRLVHGVEFAHVQDVHELMGDFVDAGNKHMRQATLQNFFARKDPVIVRQLKTQKMRSSLWAALHRMKGQHPNEVNLSVGVNIDDADTDITKVIDDLYDMLYDHQRGMQEMRDAARDGLFLSKVSMRIGQARVPLSLERLASDVGAKKFFSFLHGKGYTEKEALAIFKGVQKAQGLGFAEHGLFGIESYLRANPNAIDGLKLLGRHHVDDSKLQTALVKGGATVSALSGAAIVKAEYDERTGTPGGLFAPSVGGFAAGVAGAALGASALHGGARKFMGATSSEAGLFAKTAGKWDDSANWIKYAYMADGLANMRDMFRFSLSPIFDASRYSEAVILGQLAELPDGVRNLKLNQSPSLFRRGLYRDAIEGVGMPKMDKYDARRYVHAQWERTTAEFAAQAKGDFNAETIDSIGRRFSSVGVLGFSPSDWMSAMFAQLRHAGVKPNKAYEIVRDVHTYGVTGRSSAEMSMNFVFFPFSFTKKVLTHMGKFFAQDMGRLVVLHDSLKTYEMLSEHYDLSNEFRDRVPVLNRMARMNVLAYGIGPGRFGGVNASLIGTARSSPILGDAMYPLLPEVDEITNMFIPQSVVVNTQEDADNLMDVFKQALPAINDISQLTSDMMSQLRVVGSSSHLTVEAEQRRAWDEWRDFQEAANAPLQAAGLTWGQAMARPEFALVARGKKADISKRHPSWKHSIGDSIAHNTAVDMELQERLHHPKGDVDIKLQQFVKAYEGMSKAMQTQGLSFSNPAEVPPEIYVLLRRLGSDLAQADPAFLRLYNRFYRQQLGDLTTEMV